MLSCALIGYGYWGKNVFAAIKSSSLFNLVGIYDSNKEALKDVDYKIFNSYKNKIEISKIGTGYTTKGTGHGFGLKLVEDIVNSNSEAIVLGDRTELISKSYEIDDDTQTKIEKIQ